jgi:hypothetical protein
MDTMFAANPGGPPVMRAFSRGLSGDLGLPCERVVMARHSGAAGPDAPGGARAAGLARRRSRARRGRVRRRLIGSATAVGLAAVAGSLLFGGGGGAPGAGAITGGDATRSAATRGAATRGAATRGARTRGARTRGAGTGSAATSSATAGGATAGGATARHVAADPRTSAATRTVAVARAAVAPLVVRLPRSARTAWTAAAWVDGHPAAWMALRSGVAVMRFDQQRLHLTLHAGSVDGGIAGWTYGDQITPREIHRVIAAFNGGFKLTYSNVGFESGGHVAVPLKTGLGSIVTYTDGTTNIGAWRDGVPDARKRIFSVLQNQQLLIDRGVAAANVSSCILACWGATIQSRTVVARSGIGITAGGRLVWAAGEQLTPATLASALVGAGAVRAVELDINPDWVAGYLYAHHPSGPVAEPVLPGQLGIAGQLLVPYTRDFLAIVAN